MPMKADLPSLALPGGLETGESSCAVIHDSASRGRITVFRKPATPDPFVNAGMSSVGPDADGVERFFISCINSVIGPTSCLITENGECRTYPWKAGDGVVCVYGVAQESPDVLWLAGGSGKLFIRLELSSGRWESFSREAGRFVTAGMALDPDTGKLFCGGQTALVSFDTRSRKTVRVYGEKEKPPDNFHYDHWRLPDGSYGFILETPGLSFLRWDPKSEEIQWKRLTDDGSHPAVGLVSKLLYVEEGRVYLPHFGWLDGLTGELTPHAHPPHEEACWLGRRGDTVYGIQYDDSSASSRFIAWNPDTGKTRPLFTVADTPAMNCALAASGKVVLVDLYGTFRRYDPATGSLELTRSVETRHEHVCNVILPAAGDRVVGTPFIAQNFWVYGMRTCEGFHAGRAAGVVGQIDHAVSVGGKVYFAAYGGGQLTEFDPEQPPGYPRNPRLVAQDWQGQHGAGIATDGRVVWAAFKPQYGTLDGAMLRFDTATGEASYRNGAVGGQHILNPFHDAAAGRLVAGTSYLSDCQTATPVHDRAYAVILDPLTMDVVRKVEGPAGVDSLLNLGPLGADRWLMQGGSRLYVFDSAVVSLLPYAEHPELPEGTVRIAHAGKPGLFLIQTAGILQLWDVGPDSLTPVASLADGFVNRWWVHGNDVTFDCGRYAALWSGCVG